MYLVRVGRNVIKGEPDLKGIHGVLTQARESIQKGKSVNGSFDEVRAIIAKSNLLFKAWIDYEQELVDAELNAPDAVNRVDMLNAIFPRFLRSLSDTERTIVGSVVERAIFWARIYQAIFISFKIDGAKTDERVSNTVFEAAAFYQDILKINTFKELMDWRLMKSSKKANTRIYLSQIQDAKRTHLRREDLPELMMVVAKDFRLNDEQSKLLEGSVYFEPRENSPGLSPAMLPGKARQFITLAGSIIRSITGRQRFMKPIRALLASPILVPLIIVAGVVILYKAYPEQRNLWGGQDWNNFVDLHPEEDQEDIDSLRPELDIPEEFEFNHFKRLFWSSYRNHVWNNLKWLLKNTGALAMTMPQVSYKQSDFEKKQREEKMEDLEILIILILCGLMALVVLIWSILMILSYKPCGSISKLMTPARAGTKNFSLTTCRLVSTKRPGFIEQRYGYYRPIPGVSVLYQRAWQSPTKTFGNGVYLWNMTWPLGKAPCNGTIFNPEPMWLFSYIVLYMPLFFYWLYYRWIHYSVRTIYITVYKVVITVGERRFILGIRTLLGGNTNSPGFWTGFNNLIAPVISIPTSNISYTSTTYAYTIIV